ncbi:lysylphosphatidylglycerol synthase domain-containing protein [Cupriavidus sp. TA19]|uniref:lysylphosphatidylglycerol synthase domain-containing protein n=1 Tax=Cupriavidus sp. TA19 TaxID=701108 RepID=UPI00295F2821|nr:lysylphosphatidylglycerol synthase domain-containing protein [Cupriavidus sp. TA19]
MRIYLTLLLAVVIGWCWWSAPAVADLGQVTHWAGLLGITVLYLCSHVLRMLRLVLLTLDKRNNAFSIVSAHALTALPSSFLPFKLGEVLRLAAFFRVFDTRQKAIAVWLAERFGDVLVITIFIFGLYLLDIKVPPGMRAVFVIFVLASGIGLLGLFAVAKAFVYLNRHLVLTSLSPRGLALLRTSHVLRGLEISIHRSIEGRVSGFLLLSVLIWFFEIMALSLFINLLAIGEPDFADLFASGLLASLHSGSQNAYGIYQSLALVALTVVFLLAVWLAARFKITRI